jgi:hypothetical protein
MRKILLGTAAALLLAISPAAAKDLMLAVMDDGRGGKGNTLADGEARELFDCEVCS